MSSNKCQCKWTETWDIPSSASWFFKKFFGYWLIFWQTVQSLSQIGHTWYLTLYKTTPLFASIILFQPKFKSTLIKLAQTLHRLPKRKSWINKNLYSRMFGKYFFIYHYIQIYVLVVISTFIRRLFSHLSFFSLSSNQVPLSFLFYCLTSCWYTLYRVFQKRKLILITTNIFAVIDEKVFFKHSEMQIFVYSAFSFW